MINPIGSNMSYAIASQQGQQPTAPPKTQQSSDPQDTVHLSQAAQKAGDVDHDGDSH